MAHDLEKKWRSEDVKLQENVDFSAMLLSDRVLYGLKKAGFKKPSPIQLEAIPLSKIGKDLLVQAKSGTGKTLVFVITALEMISRKLHRPQVLILVPTREIATQICSVVKLVGSGFPKLKCYSFIGGMSVADDIENARACQIVVGTPGRVKQLVTEKALPTNSIRLLVLDEADQLLKMSFKNDINDIFNMLPEDKQVIATSATYPEKFKKLLFKYLREPHIACLNSRQIALCGMVHYAKIVKHSPMPIIQYKIKLTVLEEILKTIKFAQCLIFCNGIQKVEALYKDIKKWGFSAAYISSAKEQNDRLKAIDRLRHFKCKVLVSSDVTSRGIDAENVDLVINFDLSFGTETYMHRAGRAGRYGTIGSTISIIEERELSVVGRLQRDASFTVYRLPDPIPVDLIQKQNLVENLNLEYLIAELGSSSDSDQESATVDEVKTNDSVDNERSIIEKRDAEVVASFDTESILLDQASTEKASHVSLDTFSNGTSTLDLQADTAFPGGLFSSINEKCSDGNAKEIPETIESVVNGEKCEVYSESMNGEIINNVEIVSLSHCLKKNEVDICDDTLNKSSNESALESCENLDSVNDRIINENIDNGTTDLCLEENELEVSDDKLNKSVSESALQSRVENPVSKSSKQFPDIGDIFVSDALGDDDLEDVVKIFLKEYEANSDSMLPDQNGEEELEVERSSGEKTVSAYTINGLLVRKYSYMYKVCKKYHDDQISLDCLTSCANEEKDNEISVVPFENEICNRNDSTCQQNNTSPIEKVEPESLQECSYKLGEPKGSSLKLNCESTPLVAKSKHSNTFSESDSDSELSEEVDINVSHDLSSSKDTEEQSSCSFPDTSSSEDSSEESSSSSSESSEENYCHNEFRTGKQNPSLVSSSGSVFSKAGASKCERNHNRSNYPHSGCFNSRQNVHCPCSGSYPQYPFKCQKSKKHNSVPRCAFRGQNISGHSMGSSSRQTCGRNCFQPSEHRCDCNQMPVCHYWYKTFHNQWMHLQNCVHSAMM